LETDEQDKIVNLYKNVLAFENPTTTPKILPDHSQITEFRADAKNVKLISRSIDIGWGQKVDLRYFANDKNNFFFAGMNQEFMMSNSQALIEAIIKTYQPDKNLVINNLLDQCGLSIKNQVFLFNPNLVDSNFFDLFTQGLFNLNRQSVKGCWKIR
ncbi:hypothetical protein LDC_1260, partial [sediment metagenome]